MGIFIYVLLLLIIIAIFYYIIKTAVKNGTKEALLEQNNRMITLLNEINKNLKKME